MIASTSSLVTPRESTASTTKIEIVKAYLGAAQRNDLASMKSFFTEDFVYHVPGRGPLSGSHEGPSAAIDYFGRIRALTSGTYAITDFVDWLESADRVVLVARERAERAGASLEWTRVVLFVFRDQRIREARLFDDDLYALDGLLSL